MQNYLVVSNRPWTWQSLDKLKAPLGLGTWKCVNVLPTDSELEELNPRYIFLPHWSEILLRPVYEKYECVGFHIGDLPKGRGGTPLQHRILAGDKATSLTAFRITKELDAGPIYDKMPLVLTGTAQEIYTKAADIIWAMIAAISICELQPKPQEGEPTIYARRTPEQSALPAGGNLEQLYDHIRMLDAETYPHAFIKWGKWRLEFVDAHYSSKSNDVIAHVTIREAE